MEEKKKCKYCQSEIDKKAKVCPNCRKKQNHTVRNVVLGFVGFIFVCALMSGGDTTPVSNNNVSTNINNEIQNNNTKQEEIKKYALNEEIVVEKYGEKYTLVITNIEEMNERNQFSDKHPEQVFLISYTYKNIIGDELYISDSHFEIIDENNEIGSTYPNSISNYPQGISEGVTCKAEMVLCVNNKSNKITLNFKNNIFDSKPTAIFEINI